MWSAPARAGVLPGESPRVRALALVVTTHELELWAGVGTRFVRLQEGHWTPVSDRKEFLALADPRVREGLAAGDSEPLRSGERNDATSREPV